MPDADSLGRLGQAFGHAFARARRDRGWTQDELGEQCDLTAGYIARIERGERLPSPLVLNRLAQTLGLEVADIWPRANPPASSQPAKARGKAGDERALAIARLVRVVEGLTASEIRQLTTTVQRLVRAGKRMGAQGPRQQGLF